MHTGNVPRVAVIGHRPGRVVDVGRAQAAVDAALDRMKARQPEVVLLTGGALGFDQWVAWGALRRGIPLELYLPCELEAFTARWRHGDRVNLAELCRRAGAVRVVGHVGRAQVTPATYWRRNAALVKDAQAVVAFFDGRPLGGTWRTIEIARDLGKPVYNALAEFARVA